MAVYTFARTVDDIGDEALPGPAASQHDASQHDASQHDTSQHDTGLNPGRDDSATTAERLRLLDELEDDLGRLYRGEAPRLEVIGQLAPP